MKYKIEKPKNAPEWFAPGIVCRVWDIEGGWVETAIIVWMDSCGEFLTKDGVSWCCAEPITEPTRRKANRDEWLNWAVSEDAHGWVVKYGDCNYGAPQYGLYTCTIEHYQRARMTPQGPGEWDYFWIEGEE